MTLLAHRYVAGDTRRDALKTVRKLNHHGIGATLDLLGENVTEKKKAEAAREKYIEMLNVLQQYDLDCDISVKLTQLGMDIGHEFCNENLEQVLKVAKKLGNFVWIDMEGSAYTDRTIETYEHFVGKYGDHMGVCIQAALRRSEEDIERLLKKHPIIRLVKGAYKESAEICFKDKKEMDQNFRQLARKLFEGQPRMVMIATHDESIVNDVKKWMAEEFKDKNVVFAMLLGIRRDLQRDLVREGYRVKVYTPYGVSWLPYFVRRLRERKENLWFAIKSLFHK